ncbi:DNA-directed RNA polymerase family protein [Hibiscus syriacus]|uniref:DNA-directed RNA polymerase family protein n=1 Tax=Hibiscus syriacus TaxID=106335 RepID=A0A6A2ZPA8_HIBSY|nr:DNA-directed RNA polymerase family protein [Hibiscus syriacus]
MVAMGCSTATNSPRVETGEIDTSAPFRTVKDAITRFGESAFSGENHAIKTAKARSAEVLPTLGQFFVLSPGMLCRDVVVPNLPSLGHDIITRSSFSFTLLSLMIASLTDLGNLFVVELQRILAKEIQLHLAQNVLNKLKGRLENAETTKSQVLKDLERAKRTVDELTHKIESVNDSRNSAIKAVEAAKDRAKQIEETNAGDLNGTDGAVSQDLETARDRYTTVITKLNAAKQELRKARRDRDASLEVKTAALNEAKEDGLAVKVNREQVGKLSAEISAVKESIGKVKFASLQVQQEQAKTLVEKDSLRQLYKAKLEETADLQRRIENAMASDQESLQTITSELDSAKGSLQKVVVEESSLRSWVESLTIELENAKKEHLELKDKEAKTESIAGNLHVKLRKSRYELEASIAEESKTRGTYEEMISTLQQLLVEPENAHQEAGEMKKEIEKLKLEAEASRIALEGAEKQLTEMKVAVAMAQVEAVKASENEALKRFEIEKEIEDIKVATADALKREMAEAAKKVVEGELQRWHERAEVCSRGSNSDSSETSTTAVVLPSQRSILPNFRASIEESTKLMVKPPSELDVPFWSASFWNLDLMVFAILASLLDPAREVYMN